MENLKSRLEKLEREREKRVAGYERILKFAEIGELEVEAQIEKEEEIYKELGILKLDTEISQIESSLIETFLEKSFDHPVIADALGEDLDYIKENYLCSFKIRERLLDLAKKVNFDELN